MRSACRSSSSLPAAGGGRRSSRSDRARLSDDADDFSQGSCRDDAHERSVGWWRHRTNDQRALGTWFQPASRFSARVSPPKASAENPVIHPARAALRRRHHVARPDTRHQAHAYVLLPGRNRRAGRTEKALANANANAGHRMEGYAARTQPATRFSPRWRRRMKALGDRLHDVSQSERIA